MSNIISKLPAFLFSVTTRSLIAGMLGAAIMLLIVHFTLATPQRIATVDITGIVNQFVQSQAKLNLPPRKLQQRVNRFGHQLQLALNQVAQQHHVVLLLQEAVVADAEDLTPVVQQQLQSQQK